MSQFGFSLFFCCDGYLIFGGGGNAMKKSVIWALFSSAVLLFSGFYAGAMPSKRAAPTVNEAVLVEMSLAQGKVDLGGRFLVDPNHRDWMTVSTSGNYELQALTTMLEPDVADVKTRVLKRTGKKAQIESQASIVLRLGTSGEMETAENNGTLLSHLKLRVMKVRYTL